MKCGTTVKKYFINNNSSSILYTFSGNLTGLFGLFIGFYWFNCFSIDKYNQCNSTIDNYCERRGLFFGIKLGSLYICLVLFKNKQTTSINGCNINFWSSLNNKIIGVGGEKLLSLTYLIQTTPKCVSIIYELLKQIFLCVERKPLLHEPHKFYHMWSESVVTTGWYFTCSIFVIFFLQESKLLLYLNFILDVTTIKNKKCFGSILTYFSVTKNSNKLIKYKNKRSIFLQNTLLKKSRLLFLHEN